MKQLSTKQLRRKLKQMYYEEFDDPNESFMDFLLDLIPKKVLIEILSKGDKYYLSVFGKYK